MPPLGPGERFPDLAIALSGGHTRDLPGALAGADAVGALTGAFVNAEPNHLQSTGFVLSPEDVVGMVRRVREQAAA
jgi:hypothetical protein